MVDRSEPSHFATAFIAFNQFDYGNLLVIDKLNADRMGIIFATLIIDVEIIWKHF